MRALDYCIDRILRQHPHDPAAQRDALRAALDELFPKEG